MNERQLPRSITEGEIEASLRHECPHPSSDLRRRVAEATWQKEEEPMNPFTLFQRLVRAPWRPGLAVLTVVVMSFLTVSRKAEANFQALAREVGTVMFKETTEYPGKQLTSEPNIIYPTIVDVEDLATEVPFPVTLPSSLPEGYKLHPKAEVHTPETWNRWEVMLTWKKESWPDKNTHLLNSISLRVITPPVTTIVAPDAATEVLVNGKPAALVTGGWNAGTQAWDPTIGGTQLTWTEDEIQYDLQFDDDVSLDEALAIAATIR